MNYRIYYLSIRIRKEKQIVFINGEFIVFKKNFRIRLNQFFYNSCHSDGNKEMSLGAKFGLHRALPIILM